MDEIEIIVACEPRGGLVFELATLLNATGFKMVEQHCIENSPTSATYTVKARGPSASISALQSKFQTAPFVQRFELSVAGKKLAAGNTVTPAQAKPVVRTNVSANAGPVDQAGLDANLPKIAASYPKVIPLLENFFNALSPESKPATMRATGMRVGAWVYKRDFALGARMEMADFLRRVAVPAGKALVDVETDGSNLYLRKSPFAKPSDRSQCQFFAGFFSSLASEAKNLGDVHFEETQCCAMGADRCVLSTTNR
jgi:predicted hydrocarbon binding protein